MNFGRVLRNVATLVTLLVVWLLVMVVLAQKNRIESAEGTAAALKGDVAALQSSLREAPDPDEAAASADADIVLSLREDITVLRSDVSGLQAFRRAEESAPETPIPDPETILSLQEDVTDLRETVAGYESALRGLRLALSARNDGRLEQEIGTVKENTLAIRRDIEALKARFENNGIQ